MAPVAGNIPARLLQALLSINASAPRLIASPPIVQGGVPTGASRRASVAIIIRLRPNSSPTTGSPPSSNSSPPNASPYVPHATLAPSPPSSPSHGPVAVDPSSTSSSNQPFSPVGSATTPPIPTSNTTGTTHTSVPSPPSVPDQLQEFFAQQWVQNPGTTAEILFIKRATRSSDKWSGHVAFPGGRQEPEDEDGRYTAMRETWEEVGLDLAEKEWLAVGQLDDREITTSLGKRLLMILSPFVFLHTSPHTPMPELQESEVASAHWVPIELLHAPQARYGVVGIDISTRLAPRSPVTRFALRLLVGSMHFKCVLLPNEPVAIGQVLPRLAPGQLLPDLKLWGLTLGMTLDLLASMSIPSNVEFGINSGSSSDLSTYPKAISQLSSTDGGKTSSTKGKWNEHSSSSSSSSSLGPVMSPLAPSMSTIFPRFSYPDINALIWLFGWRYRRLVSQQQAHARGRKSTSTSTSSSSSSPSSKESRGTVDARVNWAGMSIGAYYSAVRRALVVAVLLRAIAVFGGLGWFIVWIKRKALLNHRRRIVSS